MVQASGQTMGMTVMGILCKQLPNQQLHCGDGYKAQVIPLLSQLLKEDINLMLIDPDNCQRIMDFLSQATTMKDLVALILLTKLRKKFSHVAKYKSVAKEFYTIVKVQ
jgi:hypothetical protein